jgi:putative membrane protein
MQKIIHWIINAVAVLIAAYIIPTVHVEGFFTALVVAVVLGVFNTFLRPILILLTLPITVVTLGLFALVINTLLIMLAALIVPGFTVGSFWWALLFGVVLALVNAVLHSFEK